MKKLIFSTIGFMMITLVALAQAPQKFNYQGVARTSTGSPMSNQEIGLKISVLNGSAVGASEYIETHAITTNDYGLYTLAIGDGTILHGTMIDVDWSGRSAGATR